MKTRLIKSVLALLLTFLALPMMGQDFMNVYFKNGDYHKFYMKNILEITTSKYDAEGIPHSDYDFQHVTTLHNKYVYALSDVDCITFTKCDEEQVKANINAAMPKIYSLLSGCSSIIDVEKSISSFKEIEELEDAWCDGHELYVSIPGLGPMSFFFPHEIEEKVVETTPKRIGKIKEQLVERTKTFETEERKIKAVIANQNASILDNVRTDFDGLEDDFKFCHVDVDYDKKEPLLSFFLTDIYNYDLVFLKTHGAFDGTQHWLLTSSVLGKSFINPEGNDKKWAKYYENLLDTINSDKYKDKELVYGKHVGISWAATEIGYYHPCIKVSESCLKDKSEGQFPTKNSILFNGACESLMGSESLAALYLDYRNLGIYFGYDRSNSGGPVAGCDFFRSLLKGKSVTKAYNDIPYEYRDESELWYAFFGAQLHPVTRMSGKECNNLYLFPVYTDRLYDNIVNDQYQQVHYVELNGETKTLDADAIEYGFFYGIDGNLDKQISDVQLSYYGKTDNILFQGKLIDIEFDKKYSYQAYTYDGQNYNLGEVRTFTIHKPTDIPAEAIDLGLPSGTLWASYNIGATKPEEYGDYFSWGETEVRDKYYFTTYSLCDGTVTSCHDIGENISGTKYDVAHVKWGNGWCMPTKDDFRELVYNCDYKETTLNGVKGFQFTGSNGKYIFLPYTGYCWDTENSKAGTEGSYWSATQTTSVNKAHEMSFRNDRMLWDCYINRFAGLTVRPVKR